jgi:uncharacterized membrane protein
MLKMLIVWSQYYVSEFNLRTLKNSSFDINQYYLLVHCEFNSIRCIVAFLVFYAYYSLLNHKARSSH